ncbi:hypothetical protein CCMSSC00406_0004826 [Pleurotus cornucopiae]|uniref:Uncharacterized protein n=1 Tax=Pleurotus cornucopiae TaxID=5321 RepID=A0ACB7J1K1_PLECO|nr:hypothetical protein CCMSSC00406_0004826 [Pleurotus cornucopiae]
MQKTASSITVMTTKTITFNNGETLLPSDRKMTELTRALPGTDARHPGLAFSSEATPLNPIIAKFNITDDPSAPTTVIKYEYDPSEDSESDSDDEEEAVTAMTEQESNKDKDGGFLTAETHFRDAAAMNGCKGDEGFVDQRASDQKYASCFSGLKFATQGDDRDEGLDNAMALDIKE